MLKNQPTDSIKNKKITTLNCEINQRSSKKAIKNEHQWLEFGEYGRMSKF